MTEETPGLSEARTAAWGIFWVDVAIAEARDGDELNEGVWAAQRAIEAFIAAEARKPLVEALEQIRDIHAPGGPPRHIQTHDIAMRALGEASAPQQGR